MLETSSFSVAGHSTDQESPKHKGYPSQSSKSVATANQLGNPRKAFEGVEGRGKCWEASLGARNAYLPIIGQFNGY